jgi:hypothetical protein
MRLTVLLALFFSLLSPSALAKKPAAPGLLPWVHRWIVTADDGRNHECKACTLKGKTLTCKECSPVQRSSAPPETSPVEPPLPDSQGKARLMSVPSEDLDEWVALERTLGETFATLDYVYLIKINPSLGIAKVDGRRKFQLQAWIYCRRDDPHMLNPMSGTKGEIVQALLVHAQHECVRPRD